MNKLKPLAILGVSGAVAMGIVLSAAQSAPMMGNMSNNMMADNASMPMDNAVMSNAMMDDNSSSSNAM